MINLLNYTMQKMLSIITQNSFFCTIDRLTTFIPSFIKEEKARLTNSVSRVKHVGGGGPGEALAEATFIYILLHWVGEPRLFFSLQLRVALQIYFLSKVLLTTFTMSLTRAGWKRWRPRFTLKQGVKRCLLLSKRWT